jgi:hypothetical protein
VTTVSKDFSPEQRELLGPGMKDGEAKIERYLQSGKKGYQRLERKTPTV